MTPRFSHTGTPVLSGTSQVSIRRLIAAGDLLGAYDAARNRLRHHPEERITQHLAVMALARMGAREEARRGFTDYNLGAVQDDEEILSLDARLMKDEALALPLGPDRKAGLRAAARRYLDAFAVAGGTYPLINAATLHFLAGDQDTATGLAEQCLERLDILETGENSPSDYWFGATRAEALLICGATDAAEQAFGNALKVGDPDIAAQATSLKQLRRIADHQAAKAPWLQRLAPAPVVHYAGHLFGIGTGPRDLTTVEIRQLRQTVDDIVALEGAGLAVGGLAAGADILCAEALLAAGATLHVVLPIPPESYIKACVAPFGDAWIDRFHACLSAADRVIQSYAEAPDLDDLAFADTGAQAMGYARQFAGLRASRAYQILIWDQIETGLNAGTGADAKLWRDAVGNQHIIPYPRPRPGPSARVEHGPDPSKGRRTMRATLFADLVGYGAVADRQIPNLLSDVFAPLAETLKTPPAPLSINSWGDALFLVFERVEDAADCALKLSDRFRSLDLSGLDMPDELALRVGGHVAPVYETRNPFTGGLDVFGPGVTLAARIEPTTAPGSIYVSAAFARHLMLAPEGRWRTDYVGQIHPRKHPRPEPLYALRRRS